MVDHQVDDLRLDYAPTVPGASRTRSLACRGRPADNPQPTPPDQTPPPAEAPPPPPGDDGRAALASRCNAIEEAYEFMLAYAAQGLPAEEGSASGAQIREFLRRCDAALMDLGNAITHCVSQLEDTSSQPYSAFVTVVDRDARAAQAA